MFLHSSSRVSFALYRLISLWETRRRLPISHTGYPIKSPVSCAELGLRWNILFPGNFFIPVRVCVGFTTDIQLFTGSQSSISNSRSAKPWRSRTTSSENQIEWDSSDIACKSMIGCLKNLNKITKVENSTSNVGDQARTNTQEQLICATFCLCSWTKLLCV